MTSHHTGKKGGALASAIHSHMQHGDPYIRSVIKHTLALVAQPIFSTVTSWIYDGELDDNFHEVRIVSEKKSVQLFESSIVCHCVHVCDGISFQVSHCVVYISYISSSACIS